MISSSTILLLGLVVVGGIPEAARASEDLAMRSPLPHQAADAEAGLITEANLFENDRFWPYQVALTTRWKPQDRVEPLPVGTRGVLIRIEPTGARIDFGRDGLYTGVPVTVTNVVELANQVRLGKLVKLGPNLVVAVGSRLFDSESPEPRTLSMAKVTRQPGFLAVFADPDAEDFTALAADLAPLRDRHGVLTILFPQGAHPERTLRNRLREIDWPVSVVFDHLAEPYTRSLLPQGTPLPALILLTNEGRLVFESPWEVGLATELSETLDRNFRAEVAGSTPLR